MTRTRRNFLQAAAAAATTPLLGRRTLDAMERRLEPFAGLGPQTAASDQAFWDEIRSRGLFDAEVAIKAASATEGLFCWPEDTDGE